MFNQQKNQTEEKELTPEELGEWIRNVRERFGLSQESVAEQAGYTVVQYNWIEEGLVTISTTEVYNIMLAAGILSKSPKPGLQRKFIYLNLKFNLWLVRKQVYLNYRFPKLSPVIDVLLDDFLWRFLLLSIPLILLFRLFAYEIGYAFGTLFKWFDLLIH